MAVTLFDAAKRYRNPLSQFLFRGIVTEDELFSRIAFVGKDGDAFSYNREKALGNAAFIAPGGTISESSPSTDLVTVPKREIATDVDLANFSLAQQGGDQMVVDALMKKGKAVGRLLAAKIIAGGHVTTHTLGSATNPFNAVDGIEYGPWLDSRRFGPGEIEYDHDLTRWRFRAPGDRTFGDWVTASADGDFTLKSDNPNKYIVVTLDVSDATADGRTWIEFASADEEFDGLMRMITPGQTRLPEDANGDPLSFAILDELLDAVKVRENLAFIMPPALRRKYKALYRGLGGAMPEVVIGGYDQQGNPTERRALAYEGVPILKSENIPANEAFGSATNLSSVVLVSMDPEEGLYMGAFGGSSEQIDADPIRRIVLGFQSIYVGQLETKNMQRWRQVFYGGLALGSELAVARASGLRTV